MNRVSNALFIHNLETTKQIFIPHEQIADYYYIDIYGRVYSSLLGAYLKQYMNTKGYMLVSFQTIDGRRIQERVHRLVKYTFDYIPDCENLQIDHIDGDKSNNFIGNLEWVTAQENVYRRDLTVDRSNQISFEDQIHILNLIIEGYSDEQIINIVPYTSIMKIGELLQGRYKNIPNDLLLKAREVRSEIIRKSNRTTLSEEQLHAVCKYFEDHKPPYDKFEENLFNKRKYLAEAMSSLGLDYHNKPQRDMTRRMLNKENNSMIFNQYDY